MKRGIPILIALLLLLGCSGGRNDIPKTALDEFKVGESAYVCGCPMMCCNSISRSPGGRCTCNVLLRKGTVSRIEDGRVYVRIDDGREKRFFIPKR